MSKKPKIHICPNRIYVEGNKGGSYISIDETSTYGMIKLEVGETCVQTICQEISVVALAAILTYAKDKGFQHIVNEYLNTAGGTPPISVSQDGAPNAS